MVAMIVVVMLGVAIVGAAMVDSHDRGSYDSGSHSSSSYYIGFIEPLIRIITRILLNIEIPVGISHTYIISWYNIIDIPYRGISR